MLIVWISALTLSTEPAVVATATAPTVTSAPAPERWITRHRPHTHDLTLGVLAGATFLSRDLGLHGRASPVAEYDLASAEVGIRLGYFPSRFIGLEAELAGVPTQYDGGQAFVYSARAQGVLQVGLWRVVPFVLLGGGLLGVTSDRAFAGNDLDQALHFGGGLKLLAMNNLLARIDVRDTVSAARGLTAAPTHSASVLVSLEWRFGVAPKPVVVVPEAVVDTDGDGVADVDDWCARMAGRDIHGCPVVDDDCDDVPDDVDACVDAAGPPPTGCPVVAPEPLAPVVEEETPAPAEESVVVPQGE